MFTNDLRKGDLIIQRNGWPARIEDNLKGATRLATVYGWCTEMGSIYGHDILAKIVFHQDGKHEISEGEFAGERYKIVETIELTPKQIKLKTLVATMF